MSIKIEEPKTLDELFSTVYNLIHRVIAIESALNQPYATATDAMDLSVYVMALNSYRKHIRFSRIYDLGDDGRYGVYDISVGEEQLSGKFHYDIEEVRRVTSYMPVVVGMDDEKAINLLSSVVTIDAVKWMVSEKYRYWEDDNRVVGWDLDSVRQTYLSRKYGDPECKTDATYPELSDDTPRSVADRIKFTWAVVDAFNDYANTGKLSIPGAAIVLYNGGYAYGSSQGIYRERVALKLCEEDMSLYMPEKVTEDSIELAARRLVDGRSHIWMRE